MDRLCRSNHASYSWQPSPGRLKLRPADESKDPGQAAHTHHSRKSEVGRWLLAVAGGVGLVESAGRALREPAGAATTLGRDRRADEAEPGLAAGTIATGGAALPTTSVAARSLDAAGTGVSGADTTGGMSALVETCDSAAAGPPRAGAYFRASKPLTPRITKRAKAPRIARRRRLGATRVVASAASVCVSAAATIPPLEDEAAGGMMLAEDPRRPARSADRAPTGDA